MSDSSTPSAAPTVQLDGNTPPSFDALETVLEPTPSVATNEKATKTVASVKPDKAFSFDEALANDNSGSEVKADSENQKTTEEQVSTKEAESAPTDSEEVKEEAAKSFKVKVGPRGKELDIPADAKLPVKVDGEIKEFTVQELMNIKSGEISYDKKFSDLDKREKTFTANVQQTEEELSEILTHVIVDQNVGAALLELARKANVDPAPLYTAMQKEIVGEIDKFFNMSEQERKAYLLERENAFLKTNEKSLAEGRKSKQAQAELETKITQMREALDVTDEWVSKAEADIKERPQDHNSWLKGKQPSKEQVVLLADALRRHDLAVKALNMVDPELANDPAIVEFGMQKLKGVKGVTVEEAAQAAREFFKRPETPTTTASPQATLSKKIEQAKKTSESEEDTSKKASSNKKDEEALTWDDV